MFSAAAQLYVIIIDYYLKCPGVGTALEGGFDRRERQVLCAASNSVNRTYSTSTLFSLAYGQHLV